MFNNSKYGNILTVILVIAIIAIILIVGIVAYRLYRAHYIDVGASAAAAEFENAVGVTEDTNQNTMSSGTISGIEDTPTGETTTGTKTTYKGFTVVGTIQIPTINLKYPILEKVTPKSLTTSVALLYTSKGLNEEGNSLIIGHNYRNGTMFSNVKKLKNGDSIYIKDKKGKKEISLSTCTDESKARTIVLAREG